MSTTYVTENEAQIHAIVTGVNIPAVKSWTTFEGGDAQAQTGQLQPGAGIAAVAMPGPVKRSNVTVTRPYTTELHAFVNALEAALNSGMTAFYAPTDADGNPNGDTITRTGLLREVQIPKWDAESGGKSAMLGLVMECNT